jgi:hypothetical protein
MTSPSFQHEHLRLNDGSIRLVQIHGGSSKTAPISLRITQFSTLKRPPYAAISYVWGSSNRLQPITINGKPFMIRPNLWHLLMHLRQRGESRFLWVDALCINQSDRDERNFHVQFMSRIYEEAELTIVWLGLPSDDRREARAIDFVIEAANHRPGKSGASFRELYLTEKASLRWANLLELCRCAYWSRTWIIQEFLRARRLEVLCGTAKLDWEKFDAFYTQSKPLLDSDMVSPSLQPIMRTIFATIPSRLTARRLSHTASVLQELLHEFYDARCTLPRDKVYGMLGIAADCGQLNDSNIGASSSYRGPIPDYAKHIVEVYFDVLNYLRDNSPSNSVAPLTITLLHRSLNLTEGTITQYTHALPPATLANVNAGTTMMLQPDYISTISAVIPSYTSINDLKQRLTTFDWSPYVGFEVIRPRTPIPAPSTPGSRTPTPLGQGSKQGTRPGSANPRYSQSYFSPSSSSASLSNLSPSASQHHRSNSSSISLSRQITQTIPLPDDLIPNVLTVAERLDFHSLLCPLPASAEGFHFPLQLSQGEFSTFTVGIDKSRPIPLFANNVEDNIPPSRPAVFIESSPLSNPLRIGFALTPGTHVRRGDMLIQFRGLHPNMTLIARREGSSARLRLIGRAVVVGHTGIRSIDGISKEAAVHPACATNLNVGDEPASGLLSPCLLPDSREMSTNEGDTYGRNGDVANGIQVLTINVDNASGEPNATDEETEHLRQRYIEHLKQFEDAGVEMETDALSLWEILRDR